MLLTLNVDDTPAVLTATNGLAVNDHVALRANDSKRDHALKTQRSGLQCLNTFRNAYPNRLVQLDLFVIILIRVEGVQADVVVH